jgi:hypothetical protein
LVTPPLKVLALVKMTVPAPPPLPRMKPPVPLITPPKVREVVEKTSIKFAPVVKTMLLVTTDGTVLRNVASPVGVMLIFPEPAAPVLSRSRIPACKTKPPEKLFAPLKISDVVPALVNDPTPVIAPGIVKFFDDIVIIAPPVPRVIPRLVFRVVLTAVPKAKVQPLDKVS